MHRNFFRGSILPSILLCIHCLLAGKLLAQRPESVYWLRYQNQMHFSPSLYSNLEIDNRRFFHPDVQTQLIIHSRLHYKFRRWDFAGGLTGSWAYAAQADRPISHPTAEFRPVAEATFEKAMKKWSLQQRLRIDNRFIEEDRFGDLTDGFEYTMRSRYRVQGKFTLVRKKPSFGELYLRIADEIMLNHRESTFDQNRIYLTADWAISDRVIFETGYIHIYQKRFGTGEYLERNVLRITLLHRILFY